MQAAFLFRECAQLRVGLSAVLLTGKDLGSNATDLLSENIVALIIPTPTTIWAFSCWPYIKRHQLLLPKH